MRCCLALAFLAGCSSSSSSSPTPLRDAAPDAPHAGPPSPLCPTVSTIAPCTPAPASGCTQAAQVCTPSALPTGLACAGKSQCAMAIDPCPDPSGYLGAERVDGYVCTCTAGHWACEDCYEGASLCARPPEAGAPDDASLDADAFPSSD